MDTLDPAERFTDLALESYVEETVPGPTRPGPSDGGASENSGAERAESETVTTAATVDPDSMIALPRLSRRQRRAAARRANPGAGHSGAGRSSAGLTAPGEKHKGNVPPKIAVLTYLLLPVVLLLTTRNILT